MSSAALTLRSSQILRRPPANSLCGAVDVTLRQNALACPFFTLTPAPCRLGSADVMSLAGNACARWPTCAVATLLRYCRMTGSTALVASP